MAFHSGRRIFALAVLGAALAVSHSPQLARATQADDSTVVVSMINNVFAPNQITVAAGTTVKWVNNEDPNGSDVTHDVMADDYTSWSSSYIDPGGSYSYTFAAPGTYNYLCDLHSGMVATVIVQ
jgi:plastocyanin